MDFEEYRRFDALGLAELVARGEVSAAELLETALVRAERVNPRINAIVRTMETQAKERVSQDLSGPFAGVPFLIKDLHQDFAGEPTAGGCRPLAGHPVLESSATVRRWLDAGLVIFGKTNTPEFGAKGVTEPDLFGPTRNPWALDRTPGGSSGGSAAAVAAGIVPVAGANDGGGSIRIPAGCCGLFGLKPGRGLVSSGPAFGELLHGAATNGVLSRTVRDTAAMLDVLVGPEADSPYGVTPPEQSYLSQLGQPPGRLRIGFSHRSALNPRVHPDAVAAVTGAAELLAELGHVVEPAEVDYDDEELAHDFLTAWFATMAALVRDIGNRTGCRLGDFEFDTQIMTGLGRLTTAPDYIIAHMRWHLYVRALADFHSRYDLLLTPTLSRPPIPIGSLGTPPLLRVAGKAVLRLRLTRLLRRLGVVNKVIRDNLGWVPYTQLANLTGRPAMSVPTYWTADNLPLGVQFVAPLGGEGLLLRLAAQIEEARPWANRFPPL
ncbi:putative amidase [Longimycelium tulufanense]|uniref:Putative amidase n=1 Tax=Longimycelium tulufanense TaxID=907463 RepID=A0A8J3FT60_9PSEU|nr:amidase [Longimycelium tulufanense]GGM46376.1 putative amidase [Longimycelium tulufanense]